MEVWRHLERQVDGVKLKRAVAALLHSPGGREHDRQQVRSPDSGHRGKIFFKKKLNHATM